MTGLEFWLTVIWTLGVGWTFYLIGYRTGWTDGIAQARKWVGR